MAGDRPSFEELNAYVDKELPADRAAEIARHIANDASIAHTVSVLAQLRSTLPHSIEAPDLEVPSLKPTRKRWLVAASIVFLLLACGTTLLSMRGLSGGSQWMEAAIEAHDSWQIPNGEGNLDSNTPVREAMIREKNLTGAYIPDLSASKLSIVLVDTNPGFVDDPAILVGYAGTRGCKVSLFATTVESGGPADFRFIAQGENSAYAWRAGPLAYLLIAKGMDRKRFDLIADSVYRATIERLPFDDETRIALLNNRRQSLPCMA